MTDTPPTAPEPTTVGRTAPVTEAQLLDLARSLPLRSGASPNEEMIHAALLRDVAGIQQRAARALSAGDQKYIDSDWHRLQGEGRQIIAHFDAGEWRAMTATEREAARAAWEGLLAHLSPGRTLQAPGPTTTQWLLLALFFAPIVAGVLGASSVVLLWGWAAWIVVLLARNTKLIPH